MRCPFLLVCRSFLLLLCLSLCVSCSTTKRTCVQFEGTGPIELIPTIDGKYTMLKELATGAVLTVDSKAIPQIKAESQPVECPKE